MCYGVCIENASPMQLCEEFDLYVCYFVLI